MAEKKILRGCCRQKPWNLYPVVRGYRCAGSGERVPGCPATRAFPTIEEARAFYPGATVGRKKKRRMCSEKKASDQPPGGYRRRQFSLEGRIVIYTDGSSLGNPGPGGYGVVIPSPAEDREISGGFRNTTNNRMETAGLHCRPRATGKPLGPWQFTVTPVTWWMASRRGGQKKWRAQ